MAKRIRNGWWGDPWPEGVDHEAMASFWNVGDKLTLLPDDDFILRGDRIAIPATLQAHTTNITHEGHLDIVKMKQLLQEKIWFLRIDKQVKHVIKSCFACQATTRNPEPIMSELPSGPWRRLCADFWALH